MNEQLKEYPTRLMLEAMCPSLSTPVKEYLTLPVGTASVERSFSQIKIIITRLRNHLGEVIFLIS